MHKIETQKIPQMKILDLENDEVFLIPTSQQGTMKSTAISVEQYNEQRGLQSAQNFINLEDYYDDDDDLHVLNSVPNNTHLGKRKRPFLIHPMTDNGQSSNSKNNKPSSFVCGICVEPKLTNELFYIKGCSHSDCTDCIVKYMVSKLQESITSIRCPVTDCKGVLEAEYCRKILPKEVLDRWGNVLCEAVINGAQKFYCPFKDCSALLINDGPKNIKESKCPYCRRLFCAQCKVPWLAGMKCEKFRKLNKNEKNSEDMKLKKLAEEKKWKRCPYCNYFVESSAGCSYKKRSPFAEHHQLQ